MYLQHQYIKKEDANLILRNRKLSLRVTSIALILSSAFLFFGVGPQLQELFNEFGASQFNFFRLFPYGIITMGFAFNWIIKTDNTDAIMKKELKKYKNSDMILISKIIDQTTNYKIFAIFVLFSLFIFLSLIFPIFQITKTI